MSGGKQAARNIDERLMGGARWEQIFPQLDYGRSVPGDPSLSKRHVGANVAVAVRVRTQDEVVCTLSSAEALEESRRCLRCDLRAVVAEK
jgi:hypothetical protein